MKTIKQCGVLAAIFILVFVFQKVFVSHSRILSGHEGEDSRNLNAAVAAALSLQKKSYQVTADTPQFVLLSFDGSKSVETASQFLDFQNKMAQQGKPINFTFFISAAYFLTKDNAGFYQAPREKPGISNIGFSDSVQDITSRIKIFNVAFVNGNEIASHAVGHFNGSQWSYDEWKQEFDAFNSIIFHVVENNSSGHVGSWIFGPAAVTGFRAPVLGANSALYHVLQDEHFTYDASEVGLAGNWPEKDSYSIWHIPLGTIKVGKRQSPVAAIDYSLWIHQSHGKEMAKRGTDLWNSYFGEIKKAYMDYFNENYHGSRAPVVIANHFSQWNDGAYWESMKSFAEEVCGMPHVRCVTFSELVSYLNTNGPPPKLPSGRF